MTAVYGHRGARGERTENTIEGFLHARSLGIDGIECDIALTRDFVPVVHHDPDFPHCGFIRDLSLKELQRLAPEIPTLAQALAVAPDLEWLIEIKTFPDAPGKTHAPQVMAEAVVNVLNKAVMLRRSCLLAFDWRVLAAARHTGIRLVCLTAPDTEAARDIWWGEGITASTTIEAVAQAKAHGWAPHHAALTMEQIAQARRLGLKILPWTVNEVADFGRLAPAVDGIITDFPSRFCG